jgi:ABC-type lipoprotein export system ATPase subunit
MSVLECDGLTRRVATNRTIVAGVDIALDVGESVSLVGPSGCGKTTLLSMLGLLDRPDEGTVTLAGRDAWSLSGTERARIRLERIGFVFQQHNLFE